jgi:F-type H+-transporting ATPase subunit b
MLTLPPDETFLIQIVLFVVLWFGLRRLLFDPMQRVLEEREARTTGARAEAQRLTAAAEERGADYERRIREVRQGLAVETEKARSAAMAEQQRVLSEAREQANADLGRLRESLEREAAAARPSLDAEAQQLAVRMLERVTGRVMA